MHIVYVIAPGGGPEAFVQTILPWLESQGHRVSIVYMAPAAYRHPFSAHTQVSYAPSGNLHYYVSRIIRGRWIQPLRLRLYETAYSVYKSIKLIASLHQVDVVEVMENLPIGRLARDWPVVVRGHGSEWTCRYFSNNRFSNDDQWLINQEAQQLRSAHAVSALSRHLADHLTSMCHLPDGYIDVTPYPINTNVFFPQDAARTDKNIPSILSVGRLEPRKGTHILLQAMEYVWEYFPSTRVYLVGSQAAFTKERLLNMVAKDKKSQIVFPDFVAHEVLPQYYHQVDVYAAPTEYETFGYTILEAMACGLPVVASSVGAVPELVEHNETGLLVPFGDPLALSQAIIALLSRREWAEQLGTSGRQSAQHYHLDRIAPMVESTYVKAIMTKRKKSSTN